MRSENWDDCYIFGWWFTGSDTLTHMAISYPPRTCDVACRGNAISVRETPTQWCAVEAIYIKALSHPEDLLINAWMPSEAQMKKSTRVHTHTHTHSNDGKWKSKNGKEISLAKCENDGVKRRWDTLLLLLLSVLHCVLKNGTIFTSFSLKRERFVAWIINRALPAQ